MIISSFYRIESFKTDKLFLILKIYLPSFLAESSDEQDFSKRLNEFYYSLAAAYRGTVSELFKKTEGRISLSVNFTVATDKYKDKYKRLIKRSRSPLIIERALRANTPVMLKNGQCVDIFDLDRGIILK